MTPALFVRTSRRIAFEVKLSTAGLIVAKLEKSTLRNSRQPVDAGNSALMALMAWAAFSGYGWRCK